MENREPVSGNDNKKGSIKPNPTRYNRTNLGGDPAVNPDEGDKEETSFDTENNGLEIDTGKFDSEEVDLDRSGPDNTPHQPSTETKNAQSKGDETGGSKGKPNLMGQGGYGTSGTSGTNSGGNQGYQSGIGSAGSQNGSTGYNAGSLGTKSKDV